MERAASGVPFSGAPIWRGRPSRPGLPSEGMRRRRLLTPLLAVLVVVALVFGIYAGGHPNVLPGFVRNALVDDSDAQVFDDALDRISGDFYKKVSRKDLLNASLSAAVKSLNDRYSRYIDPRDYQAFEDQTQGTFQGVGMSVQQVPDGLQVVQVFAGGPAAKAHVKRGDRIVAVDGRSLKGKSSDASTNLIKGPAGTAVQLRIRSGSKERTVRLKRARVAVPVSEGRMEHARGKDIAYVSLAQFTSGAHGLVSEKVRRL